MCGRAGGVCGSTGRDYHRGAGNGAVSFEEASSRASLPSSGSTSGRCGAPPPAPPPTSTAMHLHDIIDYQSQRHSSRAGSRWASPSNFNIKLLSYQIAARVFTDTGHSRRPPSEMAAPRRRPPGTTVRRPASRRGTMQAMSPGGTERRGSNWQARMRSHITWAHRMDRESRVLVRHERAHGRNMRNPTVPSWSGTGH